MSRTLIVSAVFPPEPVVSASLSRDIAHELAKRNDVVVLCPKPTRPHGFKFSSMYESKNHKVIRLNSYTCSACNILGRLWESYSFGTHCANYIKSNSKDLDCIYLNAWPLFSQYLIVKTAKRLNIPCVIHVQDIYPESLINKLRFAKSLFFKILLPIDVYVLKNSTAVLCISDNMKRTLVSTRNISPEKAIVVTNWQDEKAFIHFRNLKVNDKENLSAPFTFMYLGNNGPLAGVELLIESFVKANIPNSKLVIAGTGSRTNACIELAKNYKARNIEFIPVPEGMVPSIQDRADVMLLPVKKGGALSSIPSKLPAYMFSAKAIIGSLDLESDTAKSIIKAGCGIVVEPENKESLMKAMIESSQWNRDLLNSKGKAGFSYAMQTFSKKANLPKVISLIENVCYGT